MANPRPEILSQIQEYKQLALQFFHQKEWDASLQLWRKILQLDANNTFANLYIKRIQQQIEAASKEAKRHAMSVAPAEATQISAVPEVADVSAIVTQATIQPRAAASIQQQRRLKILVVDDSPTMCKTILRMLASYPDLEVVTVESGQAALDKIPVWHPDVVTLDVNMPEMDGITTLKNIMIGNPVPVIMLSAFIVEGAADTFECLSYGAVDFVTKPSSLAGSLEKQKDEIYQKIINASRIEVSMLRRVRVGKKTSIASGEIIQWPDAKTIIAMGGGEGSCNAYLNTLPYFPSHIPAAILAIVSLQPTYLETFGNYLNKNSRLLIKQAEDGEVIKENICYLCHSGNYLKLDRSNTGELRCRLSPKPALISLENVINHLFFSAAEKLAAQCIGVLLGGRGHDGIEGLKELRRVRATTIIQDPKTCLFPQLSQVALQANCVDRTLKDCDLAAVLWNLLKTRQGKTYG